MINVLSAALHKPMLSPLSVSLYRYIVISLYRYIVTTSVTVDNRPHFTQ